MSYCRVERDLDETLESDENGVLRLVDTVLIPAR